MSGFFSFGKNPAAIFGTLLVLIILGASYFFVYVPRNEKIVQERRFRCLQNIETNIHAKIDNNISMLSGLLAYQNGEGKTNPDVFNRFIKNYPKKFGPELELPDGSDRETSASKISGDSLVSIKSNCSKDQFTLQLTKKHLKSTDNQAISIRFHFKQFIQNLLPPDVFDNYVVFVNDKPDSTKSGQNTTNTLVYETFPSGLSYKFKDSLLQVKNGIISPGVRSLKIGGTEYYVFAQPVHIDIGSDWIIAGLVSADNYQKERNQLPLWVVQLLLTLAIGSIVMIPWIKLYHMGNRDKLTVADGIATVLVSMMLMSLLFFTIFKYSVGFSANYKKRNAAGAVLANKLNKAFTNELKVASEKLSLLDTIYAQNGNAIGDVKNLGHKNLKSFPRSNKADCIQCDSSIINETAACLRIDQVYWLDKEGNEINVWTSDSIFIPKINLSSRQYFKKILNNRTYQLDTQNFYLQQVVSHSTGIFTSVIAKKSVNPGTPVVAMSFTVKSLDSIIMPDGYQFAIVDTSGEVLYHSHAERNLNENLSREFADSSKFVSCLYAKSDTCFEDEYYGKQYRVEIKPVPGLPYLITIFEDEDYNDTLDTESYAFTSGMLIFLTVFLVIQIGVVFFVSANRSFFKKQLFDTSWIGPKIKSHREYNLAIIANLIVIVLMITFCDLHSFLRYIYIILFSITFIAIFLNVIFAIRYKCNNDYRLTFKKNAVISLVLFFVAVIDAAAFKTLEPPNFKLLLIYEVLLTVICSLLAGWHFLYYYRPPNRLLKNNGPNRKKLFLRKLKIFFFRKLSITFNPKWWTYTQSFALMAVTRLVVTSGIPVAFFFIYSFNYEQSLEIRYRQLNFAKNLSPNIRQGDIVGNYRTVKMENGGVYNDNIFIKSITADTGINPIDCLVKYTNEDSLTVALLSVFRLHNNDIEIRNNNLSYPGVGDEAFFNSILKDHADQPETITYFKTSFHKYISLNSEKFDLPIPGLVFLFVLTGSLFIFYFLMHKIIRKLFALNLPSHAGWENMDEQLLYNNELNKLVFVLGPPGSGKLTKLKNDLSANRLNVAEEKELQNLSDPEQYKLKNRKLHDFKKLLGNNGELLVYDEEEQSKNNVYIVDLILMPTDTATDDTDWIKCKKEALNGYSLVIINHFEYNIQDPGANSIKLDFLESLMQKGKSKIIIISTVHPLSFLDSFNDGPGKPITAEQQKDQNNNPQPGNKIPESELERWEVLLGHFRMILEPMQTYPHHLSYNDDETFLRQTIIDETKYSVYLNQMRQMTLATEEIMEHKEEVLTSDSLIFKLQITSHYFYTYIWQSLTKEEKFLLYDLAEDGLVNPFDDYNLSMLICKGLIIKSDGTLMLFNKGFRNFILTAIGNTELNRIKDQVKDNGNWSNLKAPLNLAIVAILAFLIASQQEAYTHIIAYVTALGAGVPVILRIFTLFGNNNSQKTS